MEWLEGSSRIDELVAEGEKDLHGDYGAYCYKGFRHSLCHGWASGPAAFLSQYVLGVRPAAPGLSLIHISFREAAGGGHASGGRGILYGAACAETPPRKRRNLIYMGFWELLVLAAGLSMDAFAVSVCKGLSVPELKPKHALITGLYFGGFQALIDVYKRQLSNLR